MYAHTTRFVMGCVLILYKLYVYPGKVRTLIYATPFLTWEEHRVRTNTRSHRKVYVYRVTTPSRVTSICWQTVVAYRCNMLDINM